jgi:hypothetical protein
MGGAAKVGDGVWVRGAAGVLSLMAPSPGGLSPANLSREAGEVTPNKRSNHLSRLRERSARSAG